MSHFIVILLVIGLVLVGVATLAARRGASQAGTQGAGGARGAGMTRERMVADIRTTRTSRVADEVAIVDELGGANPGYRQYCELVGTAQTAGGVIAPYSRREVAYYEIRCYRIENHGQGDVETLVAHETSIEPFHFTDGSCDTPVFVDIASFGDNVILVNSTNHIEGPNSDFSKAADAAGGRGTGTGGVVSAIVGAAVRGLGLMGEHVSLGLRGAWGMACGAVCDARASALRMGADLFDGMARALMPTPVTVGGAVTIRAGVALMAGPGRPGGPGGPHGGRGRAPDGGGPVRPRGNRPAPRPAGPAPRPREPMPPGMGRFLGGLGMPGGYSGVPRPRPRPRNGAGDMLTGMALGTLLATLATNGDGASVAPGSTFRGYRLVEDVVPLGSPVYCIGELYRSGERHTMGRSLSADYPTSYFAARPEAEVLSRLGG